MEVESTVKVGDTVSWTSVVTKHLKTGVVKVVALDEPEPAVYVKTDSSIHWWRVPLNRLV